MLPRLSLLCALSLLACARCASADEITLKDGRVIEGEVTLDDGKVVKIKLKKGSLTLDRKDVVGIVKKMSAEQEYAQRKSKLPPNDAKASLDLAVWCASKALEAEAILHFVEAHGLDATLKVAADELEKRDYHLVGGAWQDPDTYYPGVNWLKLNNKWYHPLEYAWRLCELDVVKAKAALDENRADAALAGSPRSKSQAEAEQKKLDGFASDLALANKTLVGLKEALEIARQKRAEAEQTVKTGEIEFEASKPGEGGTLAALSRIRELRRKLSTAQAAETKAEKAVTEQEKKVAAVEASVAVSTARIAALSADTGDTATRVAQLDALVPALEAELAKAKALADEAREKWEKRAK